MHQTMSPDYIWTTALDHIKTTMEVSRFDAIFKRTKAIALEDGVFRVAAPNAFDKDWILNAYREITIDTLSSIIGNRIELNIEVDPSIVDYQLSPKKETQEFTHDEVVIRPDEPAAPAFEAKEKVPIANPVFDPLKSFDSFVVGTTNEFAYSTALAVAEDPGSKFNPFFIWGDSGLGKTHLLNAIGHYITKNFPTKRVAFVTSEEFVNEFVQAARKQNLDKFRNYYYNNIDVLLIDDIQFFKGKEETADAFFHIFNEMSRHKRQIVITADRAPSEIGLDERMTSRFGSGVTTDIQPPSYEVRLAIITQFVNREQIPFDTDAMTYIAEHSSGNIREMEGLLTRVIAFAGITNKDRVTLDILKSVAQDYFKKQTQRPITIIEIQKEVARFYGVNVSDIIGTRRTSEIIRARHVAMYLSQELTENSLPKIGDEFGNKDHSTVIHARDKIKKELNKDAALFNEINRITEALKK